MFGDQSAGEIVIGDVRNDRGEGRPELEAKILEGCRVSADTDDTHTRRGEADGSGSAEAAACSGDDGRSAGGMGGRHQQLLCSCADTG